MRAYPSDSVTLSEPLPSLSSSVHYPSVTHRQDDSSASPTDSEDSGLRNHEDSTIDVEDGLDEESTYLTSQTLNADGTPKRPMNAFMIFARRRRPQISADHQSLRTGDISKLLSQEWNTMHTTDKQFYLDKAKLLKDRFNNKYPDYVYRRRPNNSRRRRKDGAVTSRMGDGHGGMDEWTPDDHNSPHDAPASFAEGKTAHPLRSVPGTTSGYSYPPPSSVTYGHVPPSDPRFTSANATPISTDSTTATTMGAARHAHPHSFYNHTSLSHSPLSPTYRLEDSSDWSHSSEQRNHGHRPTPGWYGNHERDYPSHASKPAYLHSTNSSSWANHSISPPPIITSPAPSSRGDMLSTLNSPFYPGQGHENPSWMQSHYSGSDAASSPAHAHPESPLQFTHPPPGLRHVSSYEDRDSSTRHQSAVDHEPLSSSSSSSYPPSASHTRPASSLPPYYDAGPDPYSRPHTAFQT